jgi:hypothetical protein
MRLTESEYYKFMDLHPPLIHFTGKKLKMLPDSTTLIEFKSMSPEKRYPIRNALYENLHFIEEYINEHSEDLTAEDKEILSGFKNVKQGTFHLMKLSSKYAYFLGDNCVFGVHALNDPFESFFRNNDLPLMVEVALLPFKGKIIYDGLISSYRIQFGKTIRSSMDNQFKIAMEKYGVITTLPFEVDKSKDKISPETELRILMKTATSREYNWPEIENLLNKYPSLKTVYINELGRINSSAKKKQLKALGIKNRWFAIYDDTILASESNEASLKKLVETIVHNDVSIHDAIFYFKL